MLEPEKLQNRGKQGWPDAGKGTGHKGDKKVNTLVRHKWTPIEQPNALGGKQRLPKQGKNVCSITGQPNALGGKQRLPKQGQHHRAALTVTSIYTYKFLHALRGCCSRSLPRCATGNGLQTTSLAACSGSPHNARIH